MVSCCQDRFMRQSLYSNLCRVSFLLRRIYSLVSSLFFFFFFFLIAKLFNNHFFLRHPPDTTLRSEICILPVLNIHPLIPCFQHFQQTEWSTNAIRLLTFTFKNQFYNMSFDKTQLHQFVHMTLQRCNKLEANTILCVIYFEIFLIISEV